MDNTSRIRLIRGLKRFQDKKKILRRVMQTKDASKQIKAIGGLERSFTFKESFESFRNIEYKKEKKYHDVVERNILNTCGVQKNAKREK